MKYWKHKITMVKFSFEMRKCFSINQNSTYELILSYYFERTKIQSIRITINYNWSTVIVEEKQIVDNNITRNVFLLKKWFINKMWFILVMYFFILKNQELLLQILCIEALATNRNCILIFKVTVTIWLFTTLRLFWNWFVFEFAYNSFELL